MNQDLLKELRGLMEKATPGPWFSCPVERPVRVGDAWSERGWTTEFVGFEILGRDDHQVHCAEDGLAHEEDAALIVALVNALPRLLAVLEEREELVEGLEKAIINAIALLDMAIMGTEFTKPVAGRLVLHKERAEKTLAELRAALLTKSQGQTL